MSEYQYYEFLAIDRPLTSKEMEAVGNYSTRAEITPTSFVNVYHWADFRGSPEDFLKRFFDAMVYVANWGTRQFMFRLPRDIVDLRLLEPYCTETSLNIKPLGTFYLFDICFNEESPEYDIDGEGWMASLAGLRAEVLAGDLRPLYLAWLADLQMRNIDDSDPEPPVPPGLSKLSASQTSLVEFLAIDMGLVQLAAANSKHAVPDDFDPAMALTKLSTAEKDRWLLELIENPDPHAAMRLRLKLQGTVKHPASAAASSSNRTAGQLFQAWQRQTQEIEEQKQKAAEKKRQQKADEAAALRERQLSKLARNTETAWKNAEQLIGLRTQDGYRQATQLLQDLKAVSERPDQDALAFHRRFQAMIHAHARKQSFIDHLRKAKL